MMQKHWRQRLWELTPRFLTGRSIPLSLINRRFFGNLKRFYHRTPFYHWTLPNQAEIMLSAAIRNLWKGKAEIGLAIKKGSFVFASINTSYPALWQQPDLPDYFWRYFHGFSWLRDLQMITGPDAAARAEQIITDWLQHQPVGRGLAWDLDITAERLDEWISYIDPLKSFAKPETLNNFVLQLKKHWFHLERNLPGPLFGSQLIYALKSFLKAWLLLNEQLPTPDYFFRLLEQELQQQTLSTDGHIERNPTSQLMLLAHLIDLCTAFADNNQPVPSIWQEAVIKLAQATFYVQQPDGGLPGFNGSRRDKPWQVQQILSQSNLQAMELFSAIPVQMAGYCRLQAGQSVVLLDTGLMPAVPYDSSMHASALSFEFYAGEDAVIVNCGHHPSPAWHDVQRATAAHSTLVINDTNSAFLSRKNGIIKGPQSIQCQRQEENGNWWLEASHDGYQKLFGATHTRHLYLASDGHDLRGEDSLKGKGGYRCAIRFHLHPNTTVKLEQAKQTAILQLPSGQLWQLRTTVGNITSEESVYLGAEGEIHKSQQLVIGNLPTNPNLTVKWALSRKEAG